MPQGDKSKYTDKQERKADHIAEGYEAKGVPEKEADRRAWATVNKDDGGGKKPGGSGRGKKTGHPAAHKGGEKGGKFHNVENRTGEVTHELLQEVGLLRGDFVESIALATGISLRGGETSAELSVEDCKYELANACWMNCSIGKHSRALPGCGLVRQRIGSHVTSAPQRLGISSKLVPSLQIAASVVMKIDGDENR